MKFNQAQQQYIKKLIKKAVKKAKIESFKRGLFLGATGEVLPEKREEVINIIKKEINENTKNN